MRWWACLTARRGQFVVERVLDQGMREPVPRAVGALNQYCRGDRVVHEIQQRILVDVGQASEQADVELAADDCRQREDTQRFGAEAFHAPPHHVADAGGKADVIETVGDGPAAVVTEHDPARLGEVSNHLAREERVPVGLSPQRVRQPDTGVVKVIAG